ncbi:hypothetical protein BIW11_10154 [Tropilaelaps mercedesae]|uniref:Uncharacterized protein n=1 Tax=Tropilaelaps mercedesae TaxID=418985 RepID=A0A1V9XGZ1_9ACAR|nr:hypothetical protein BIW11_10154 [Tropilaelaps mercedesae]
MRRTFLAASVSAFHISSIANERQSSNQTPTSCGSWQRHNFNVAVGNRQAGSRRMKTLLSMMAMAAILNVALNARIFRTEPEENLAADIDSDEDEKAAEDEKATEDEKAAEDKELDKALQEILYQDEDQDLVARASAANADATLQCRAALPNVSSVIGYSNFKHPCVAFCKYRYTVPVHGRAKELYGGTYIAMNLAVSCSGPQGEYVCVDGKCVLPATSKEDEATCQALIANPVGKASPFVVEPCKLLCADTGLLNKHNNKTQFKHTYQADGTSCLNQGRQATCVKGLCSVVDSLNG